MTLTLPQVDVSAEQLQQFREEGYVLIENALDPFGLDRVRAAYENVQRQTEADWRAMVQSGNIKGGYGHGPDAHTMGNAYAYDSLFLDIADNPVVIPFLEASCFMLFQAKEAPGVSVISVPFGSLSATTSS